MKKMRFHCQHVLLRLELTWVLMFPLLVGTVASYRTSPVRLPSNDDDDVSAIVLNLESDFDAVPDDRSGWVLRRNSDLLSYALQHNASNNTLLIPRGRKFYLRHGVSARYLHDAVIRIDGSLMFERDKESKNDTCITDWGRRPNPCILLEDSRNVTITSSLSLSSGQRGLIDGGGPSWWGLPFLGYLKYGEKRPFLFLANRTTNMLIENVIFKDAPLYTLHLENVNNLTIRHTSIISRRTKSHGHSLLDLSAFNTDGIDVSGHNVHVHDVDIWNQDDCIAVKENGHGDLLSSNMTFERINASGLGLAIGSIGGATVRNITFKDCYLHKSFKGIYMKFRDTNEHLPGIIEDIVFQNITMEAPMQWSIWIGPAQQAISKNPCAANPCSLCWPIVPGAQCYGIEQSAFKNITLRDVIIRDPQGSPGVILGHKNNPIDGIVFENVLVTRGRDPRPARHSRYNAFPGLRGQHIHDKYVSEFKHLLSLGLVLFTLLLFTLCVLCRCCYRCRCKSQSYRKVLSQEREIDVDSDEPLRVSRDETEGLSADPRFPCLKQRVATLTLILLMALSMGLLALFWIIPLHLKRTNATAYFTCKGVSDGVALGNTWPVPGCFEDRTVRGGSYGWEEHHYVYFTVLSMVCLLLFFFISAATWRWTKSNRRTFSFEEDDSCIQMQPLPLSSESNSFVSSHDEDERAKSDGNNIRGRSITEETAFSVGSDENEVGNTLPNS